MRQRVLRVVAAALLLHACAPPAAEEPASRYPLVGRVVGVDRQQGMVTLEHDEVPGFMAAMTMPFNVRDEWVFEAATAGATVRATLVVQGSSSWLEDVVVSDTSTASAMADIAIEQPEPGSEVPDIALVDQDGQAFTLAQLRGRWLALTFIYTRCPLPDFCPRMSEQFRIAHRAIAAEPEVYGDTTLLSVTVDPAFDTPAVLREYGMRYLDGDGFERWRFARAEPEQLLELSRFSGLRTMPDGVEVVHNLRTLLIDPQGRVVETFLGNTWTSEQLLGALATAGARPSS